MAPTFSDVFYGISPYHWGYIGIALALGLSIAGAAWFIKDSQYINILK